MLKEDSLPHKMIGENVYKLFQTVNFIKIMSVHRVLLNSFSKMVDAIFVIKLMATKNQVLTQLNVSQKFLIAISMTYPINAQSVSVDSLLSMVDVIPVLLEKL